MKLTLLIIASAFFLFPSTAGAEPSPLYRYRDATGTTHIVTHKNDLPEAFRTQAKRMKRKEVSGRGSARLKNDVPIPLVRTVSGLTAPVHLNATTSGVALIDTGAELSVISPKLARALGLGGKAKTMIRLVTPTGSMEAPLVRLTSLTLGGATVTDLPVVVTRVNASPGVNIIVGLDFLARFEFETDSGAPSLSLYELR